MKTGSMQKMTTSALLIALGIAIPMFSPLKFVLEPASYTLASHVPIFIAMFISPFTAVAVAIGTSVGFFLGGFPLLIFLRASSHLIFVLLGAYYLKAKPNITESKIKLRVFSFLIGVVHALAEVAIVSPFYLSGGVSEGYYQSGFAYSVLLLVGVGGLIHSMIDFELAWFITKSIGKKREINKLFTNINLPSK